MARDVPDPQDVEEILQSLAKEFSDPAEFVDEYERVFLRRAESLGLLDPTQIEASMWVADRLEQAGGLSRRFPLIEAVRLEGYLSRPQIQSLHRQLLGAA